MKKPMVLLAATLGLVAALPALAQVDNSLYVGASLGQANSVNACALGPAPCEKKRDTAGSIFGGYQFNRYLGLEIGWHAFGRITVGGQDIKTDAVDGVAVFTLPLQGRLAAFAKAGAYHSDTKSDTTDVRKNGGTFGWGIQYEAGRAALRGEWQRYMRTAGGEFRDTTNIDVLSAAILFRFR